MEVWYGGLRLSEYFKKNETKHVKIYDKKINNFDFLKIIDGAVTIHGTISFELSYLGKPVLCSDKSSYTDFNFTINSKSRVDYVKKIKSNWWDNFDEKKSYYKSCLTAGWVYGVPDWQKSLIFPDDVHKDDNCKSIIKILKNNPKEVNKEIIYIREWYKSSEKLYNVFKLKNSKKVVDLISSQLARNS